MLNNHFIKRISEYIQKYSLLDNSKKYIVALSGGADSICLFSVLKLLKYNIEAAHCNFHLRGSESDRDEMFCRDFCEKHNVKINIIHFSTESYAKKNKLSIEMAARELRYNYFNELILKLNAGGICVGHHMNDNAETVLMNIIRGTGLKGLIGMEPINGNIIRPFLTVTRNDIECYLRESKIDYITDTSNLKDNVLRNKLRLNIVPLIESINPSFINCIYRTSQNICDAQKVLSELVDEERSLIKKQEGDYIKIEIKKFEKEYIFYEIMKEYGFSPSQIRQIYDNNDKHSGKTISSSTHTLLVDRECFIIKKIKEEEIKTAEIKGVGVYALSTNIKVKVEEISNIDGFLPSFAPNVAYLDAAKVSFPLIVCKTNKGDKFIPFGMNGTKLVSDYLTNKKKTLFEKQQQLVLKNKENTILWLIEHCINNKYRITQNTKKIIIIELLR